MRGFFAKTEVKGMCIRIYCIRNMKSFLFYKYERICIEKKDKMLPVYGRDVFQSMEKSTGTCSVRILDND